MREAVGIVARVGIAGQLERPFGELEAEGVPALGAPALADPPALYDHVLASATLEQRAHREAGLAAPDDHGVMVLSHALLRTSLRVEPSVSTGPLSRSELLQCSRNKRLNARMRDCSVGR